MGLDRINSNTGGGPKYQPDKGYNTSYKGANPMPHGGSTPGGRASAKANPKREVARNKGK